MSYQSGHVEDDPHARLLGVSNEGVARRAGNDNYVEHEPSLWSRFSHAIKSPKLIFVSLGLLLLVGLGIFAMVREKPSGGSSSPSGEPSGSPLASSGGLSSDSGPATSLSFPTTFSNHSSADDVSGDSVIISQDQCEAPYPGYPFCEEKVNGLLQDFPKQEAFYRSQGVDGTKCSILTYLNKNGFYCPEAVDYRRQKIRGVNLGGWLVLEPWITPSLFAEFENSSQTVQDQWTWCAALGPSECSKRLEKHWDTWLTEEDIKKLAEGGINHVRIPVGYWIMGDIRAGEPWVLGDLKYLERAIGWCAHYGIHVVLDLHCAPGSQNGFDNSGRKGEIHFSDSDKLENGRVVYPNINRALEVIDAITSHFSQRQFVGTVVAIELANEIFITVPIEIVKDFYVQGYSIVKKYGDLAVIIGDSFRFSSWGDFMFPPHYRHVWIDTHIYQVFDMFRLSLSWAKHIETTCKENLPQVAVAPLSTMVGEWSLATTDCAKWLNGFGSGSRYDGTFPGSYKLGSCENYDKIETFSQEYKDFLREFGEKQMDAYEQGSSAGWFFWNFKTESAPTWNYLLGLEQGWIPKDHSNRKFTCAGN